MTAQSSYDHNYVPPAFIRAYNDRFYSFLSQYALTYEVQEATEINSLMRANTAITRMMTTYCRYTVWLVSSHTVV